MRAYNNNISAKANESLTKRERAVKMQKRIIFITLVTIEIGRASCRERV